MPDFMERMACLRASIGATSDRLWRLPESSLVAAQLREHLAALLELERRLLATVDVATLQKLMATRPAPALDGVRYEWIEVAHGDGSKGCRLERVPAAAGQVAEKGPT